jgi:membrane-bound lytic murein transglycosylase D
MRIEREIKRGRGQDYWSLNRLPRQTRGYVPAYLATRAIRRNPTQYGFPPLGREIPFECETVQVEGSYRLEHIAQAAGLEADVVQDLNPEFVRGVTPPGYKGTVRLPRKADTAFQARLASVPQTQVKATKVHRVRSGETLAGVARKYGTTVAELKALPENRGVKSGRLKVGQEIVIPTADVAEIRTQSKPAVAAKDESPQVAAKTSPAEENSPAHEIVYTVHRGETLGRIGSQLGVSVDEICRQNRISDPNTIQPGMKLRVRVNSPEPDAVAQKSEAKTDSVTAAAAPHTHTVQAGETVWSIARTYGQDPIKILTWNRLDADTTIFPGQRLIVGQE